MTKAEQAAMRSYLKNVLKVTDELLDPIMSVLAPMSNVDAAHAVQAELDKIKPKG